MELVETMNCREFRDRHLAFFDNTLTDIELVEMHRHLGECTACSHRDTAVRRGLLILRNLPQIQPSSDFTARLNAKLRHVKQAEQRAELYRGPGIAAFIASAAGVVAVGFLAGGLYNAPSEQELRLAPVVAMEPARPAPTVASQAFAASASSVVPVLPVVMFAEQAPAHFLDVGLQLASWNP